MRNLNINFDIKNTGYVGGTSEIKGCKVEIDMTGATEEDLLKLLEKSNSPRVAVQASGIRDMSPDAIREMFVKNTKKWKWNEPWTVGGSGRGKVTAEQVRASMTVEELIAELRKRGENV